MMAVLTIEEARAYARDYESRDEDILALIDVVDAMIEDGVKANYDRTCPQAKQLARMYVADLTDDRGVSAAQASTRRDIVSSLTLQLRNKTEEAASDVDAALEVSS